jgi:hypothetical protein
MTPSTRKRLVSGRERVYLPSALRIQSDMPGM